MMIITRIDDQGAVLAAALADDVLRDEPAAAGHPELAGALPPAEGPCRAAALPWVEEPAAPAGRRSGFGVRGAASGMRATTIATLNRYTAIGIPITRFVD